MDESREELREAGRRQRVRAQGMKAEALQNYTSQLDSDVAGYIDEFIFGQVWNRPGLDHHERMLVAITALAATEHPNQLRNYLHGALQDGLDPRKIQEALVMLTVYAGFPVALEALMEWQKVIKIAREQGVTVDLASDN